MKKPTTVLVFGDSIAYGEDDREYGGWVNRLKNKHFCFVYNLGIPGDTTSDTLKRFESETRARFEKNDNTIIIFAVGINDTAMNTTYTEFEKNINDLIARAKKITPYVMFVGMTRVDETKVNAYRNKRILEFDTRMLQACKDTKTEYIQMYKLLNLHELPDGLHPNAAGHQKMCDTILLKIKSILE